MALRAYLYSLTTGFHSFIGQTYLPPSQPQTQLTTPLPVAVGVSLTASYGTISIRHPDGTFQDIGRVDGNRDYIEMMERLSSPDARHPAPPYTSMDAWLKDIPRHVLRTVRKWIGLPASSDSATISHLLDELLTLLFPWHISPRPYGMMVGYPGLVALYNEDIVDAAEFSRISILATRDKYEPREMIAAYAGHGFGLCSSYYDEEKCREEGLKLQGHEVVLAEYTEHALVFHKEVVREARDSARPFIGARASFALGTKDNADRGYFERLKSYIQEYVEFEWRFVEHDEVMVVVTGSMSSSESEYLCEAILAAVARFGTKIIMFNNQTEFVAARGAAELAWRYMSIER